MTEVATPSLPPAPTRRHDDPPPRIRAARAGSAGVAYRRRGLTVLAWLLALVLATGLSTLVGGDFAADYTAPGSDSRAAQQLLADRFPARSGDTVNVVVRADAGVASSAVRADIETLLAQLAATPHVTGVDDPYRAPGGVSADGRTLVAHLQLDVINPSDLPLTDSTRMLDLAQAANRADLRVAVGGQAIQLAERGDIGSEGIGLLAAAVILLVTFGSVVAAGLPILVAVAGLAVSAALTGLLLRLVDAPDWSTSLATMMGIGIGIDYALLMVTRFREWRAAGLEPEAATVATLDTAGRSVLVAGGTVVVSMLGLFAMGLSFMRGAALVTIIGVLVVVAASVTLFPALLGYLGRHVDRLRLPLRRRAPHAPHRLAPAVGTPSRAGAGYGGAGWSAATGSSPPQRGWPCCWRSRRRSSGSASGSPTPATIASRHRPARRTTCWPTPSVPAPMVRCCWPSNCPGPVTLLRLARSGRR